MSNFWERLIDLAHGFLVSLNQRPKGSVVTLGYQTKLGSGYSVENERKEKSEKLNILCLQLINEFPSKDFDGDGKVDETYCNFAVQKAARYYGYKLFDNKNANSITEYLELGLATWHKDNGLRAAYHAMIGGLAIAAKKYPKHGHVAVIAPRPCEFSGSWGKEVPIVANVGKKNGFMKVSEAFPVKDGEPGYYLYGETV
mgnify:CR=1 FL=1